MADISDLINTIRNENIKIQDAEKKRKKDTDKKDAKDAKDLQKKITNLEKEIKKASEKGDKAAQEEKTADLNVLKQQQENNKQIKDEAKQREATDKQQIDLQAKTFGISQQQYSTFLENKKTLDEEQKVLDDLKKAIQENGGSIEDNSKAAKEFRKKQISLDEQNIRNQARLDPDRVTSRAKAEAKILKARGDRLLGAIKGLGIDLKGGLAKLIPGGASTLDVLKKGLFAGALFALTRLVTSEQWTAIKDTVEDIIVGLKDYVIPILLPIGTFFLNNIIGFFTGIQNIGTEFEKLFGPGNTIEERFSGFLGLFKEGGKIVLGLATITGLLAPKLLFAGLKLGIKAFTAAAAFAGTKLTDLGASTFTDEKGRTRDKTTNKFAKKGSGRGVKALAKGALKAAAFGIPGIGLATSAIFTLVDGVTAGFEEAGKEGSTKLSILKEGIAGAISGFTFGFASQEGVSGKLDAAGESISNTVNSIKSGAASLIEKVPTFEEAKASLLNFGDKVKTKFNTAFTKASEGISNAVDNVKSKAASLIEKVPSFEEVKTSFLSFGDKVRTRYNELSLIKIPSFTELKDGFTKLKDGVQFFLDDPQSAINAGADKVKETFNNISNKVNEFGEGVNAGIKDVTGVDVKATLSNLGSKLKNILPDFSNLKMPDLSFDFPDFKNPFSGIVEKIQTSDFLKDGDVTAYNPIKKFKGVIKSALTGIFGGEEIEGKKLGGVVRPNQLYVVGEEGPELLKMGPVGGEVINNQRTQQMTSSALERASSGGRTGEITVMNAPSTSQVTNASTYSTSKALVNNDAVFQKLTSYAI